MYNCQMCDAFQQNQISKTCTDCEERLTEVTQEEYEVELPEPSVPSCYGNEPREYQGGLW